MFAQQDLQIGAFVRDGVLQLNENGYVIYEKFLDPGFVDSIYAAYKERIESPVSYAGGVGRRVDFINVAYADLPLALHPNVVRFAVCEPIVQIIEGYLGGDIGLSYVEAYRTHIIADPDIREALETPGVFSGWHSDANLTAPNRGYRCMVSMVYMNDVKPGGGGLQIIRGSHTYGSQKRAWTPEEVEEHSKDIVEVCAPAGSVIFFDMEIIHRAGIPTDHYRDILRCMYVPEGGYTEPLIFSNDALLMDLSPKAMRLLRFGQPSSIALPLSKGVPQRKYLSEWFRNNKLRTRLGKLRRRIRRALTSGQPGAG